MTLKRQRLLDAGYPAGHPVWLAFADQGEAVESVLVESVEQRDLLTGAAYRLPLGGWVMDMHCLPPSLCSPGKLLVDL